MRKKNGNFKKFGFKRGILFLYIVYRVWMCFQHEMLLLVVNFTSSGKVLEGISDDPTVSKQTV